MNNEHMNKFIRSISIWIRNSVPPQDPLVEELDPEAFQIIAPMEFVINVGMVSLLAGLLYIISPLIFTM